jgi:hypothetical protein
MVHSHGDHSDVGEDTEIKGRDQDVVHEPTVIGHTVLEVSRQIVQTTDEGGGHGRRAGVQNRGVQRERVAGCARVVWRGFVLLSMAADALDDLDRRVATDAGLLADSNNAGPLQDDVRRALNYKAGRKSEWSGAV